MTTPACHPRPRAAREYQYGFDFDAQSTWPENEQADGQIREIEYSQEHPWITEQRILPLLRGYTGQPRWQLWLTPGKKPSRHWLQASGLSVERMILASHLPASQLTNAMINALQSGNYSLIISWIAHQITPAQYQQLSLAARQAHSAVVLLRPTSPFLSCAASGEPPRYTGFYH